MVKKSLVLLTLVFYFTVIYAQPTHGDSSLESGAGGVVGGGAPIGGGTVILIALGLAYLDRKMGIAFYVKDKVSP